MSDVDRSEPDPELAPRLAALPTHMPPPDALESRVVRAVRTRRQVSVAIAASAALFFLGVAAGRFVFATSPPPTIEGGYVLLLYEDREAQPREEAARVEEYRAWARQIAGRGIAISGERLELDGVELERRDASVARRVSSPGNRLAGYFIVGAPNRQEAERIASTCPHLRHGGRVVVKAILPT
jgi:hypothetical protein